MVKRGLQFAGQYHVPILTYGNELGVMTKKKIKVTCSMDQNEISL